MDKNLKELAEDTLIPDWQSGDIAILFTDGIADNLWLKGFAPCIEKHLSNGVLQDKMAVAECLAIKAQSFSKNEDVRSPFMVDVLVESLRR